MTINKLRAIGAHAAAGMLAVALIACDSGKDAVVEEKVEPSPEMQAFLESPPQADSRTQTGGAHRSSDPHAKLGAEQLARVALQHLDESREQLAIETLNEGLERFPGDAMLLSLRASIYLQGGQTSLALTDLNHAIEANPHDPALLTNRAQALRQFGRDEDARKDLDGAIELDDRYVAAYFNRGSLAFEAEDYVAALADFDRCIEIQPGVAAAWFNRASTHEAMGNREQAVADLEHFLTLELDEGWVQMGRDLLAQWQGGSS
jgi:tetratricopeptide (TPR) repeat protein